jgi:hypothetical protein
MGLLDFLKGDKELQVITSRKSGNATEIRDGKLRLRMPLVLKGDFGYAIDVKWRRVYRTPNNFSAHRPNDDVPGYIHYGFYPSDPVWELRKISQVPPAVKEGFALSKVRYDRDEGLVKPDFMICFEPEWIPSTKDGRPGFYSPREQFYAPGYDPVINLSEAIKKLFG